MPIPDDFASESMYAPEAWFIHELISADAETRRMITETDTTRLGLLVDKQKVWPGHDRHLPGAIVIQMTATLGQLSAVYVLGMRATDGWVGFGTHIHKARFPSLGTIGPAVRATTEVTRVRKVRGPTFIDYRFRFEQEGRVVYEAEHTAAWLKP